MAQAKFYHALNCNRRIGSKAYAFDFRPYALVAGTWCGLYATDDAGEQAALDALIAEPRQAVSEISQEEYEAKLSRPSGDAARNYSPLLTKPANLLPEPLIEGSRAVVVEHHNAEPVKPVITGDPLPKAIDALQVGSVETPKQS